MALQPIKDINEYKRIKESLKERFSMDRTGDENLFRELTKLFQPLINTQTQNQQQTVKAIKDSQDSNSAALLPMAIELQRRNDQLGMLSEQPFNQLPIDQLSDQSPKFIIDLDAHLNETDIENLQDMNLELPSEVFKNKTIGKNLEIIKTKNKSLGQKLGKASKITEKERDILSSQKDTLATYRQLLIGLGGATQFVSTPKKSGKGIKNDVIFYPNVDDLCSRLVLLDSAKQAGNTGLDNTINSILDELLRVNAIDKDTYNTIYKNIFHII